MIIKKTLISLKNNSSSYYNIHSNMIKNNYKFYKITISNDSNNNNS